jgi:subtilisin family serine protease
MQLKGVTLVLWFLVNSASAQDCWLFLSPSFTFQDFGRECNVLPVGYSKWFHAVGVENWIESQHNLCGIDSSWCYSNEPMPSVAAMDTIKNEAVEVIPMDSSEKIFYDQITLMQGEQWIEKGYTGKGVTIGVLDAGFLGFSNDSMFQHIIKEGRIIDQYDFVERDNKVERQSTHGTAVMSCLAGLDNVQQLGLAVNSRFLLARAEQANSSRLVKEVRWVEALEWAVEKGAQIVTSSLIYSNQLYRRTQMNGSSLISRAAEKAFLNKNVLVLNSAGNADQGAWEIIGAPGDAPHVLTVGACESNGLKCDFSSVGPTHDLRAKPNVVAKGVVFVSANNEMSYEQGTSFSCPLVAGFVACMKEQHPEWSASDLFDQVQKSSDLYPYYDYAHGHGIPQAAYFLGQATDSVLSYDFHTEDLSEQLTEIKIVDWSPTSPDSTLNGELFFFHIENMNGILEEYWVARPNEEGSLGMYEFKKYAPCIVRVSNKKQMAIWKFDQ